MHNSPNILPLRLTLDWIRLASFHTATEFHSAERWTGAFTFFWIGHTVQLYSISTWWGIPGQTFKRKKMQQPIIKTTLNVFVSTFKKTFWKQPSEMCSVAFMREVRLAHIPSIIISGWWQEKAIWWQYLSDMPCLALCRDKNVSRLIVVDDGKRPFPFNIDLLHDETRWKRYNPNINYYLFQFLWHFNTFVLLWGLRCNYIKCPTNLAESRV